MRPMKAGLKIEHVSLASLGAEEEVRTIVGVWCKRQLRMKAEKWVGMCSSGMVAVYAAFLLAGRSRPCDAGEVEGRVIWNLCGYGLSWAGMTLVVV